MLPIVLPLALSIACNGKNETTDDSQGRTRRHGRPAVSGQSPYETYYPDDDADGLGRTDEPLEACQPTPKGYSLRPDDCDDTNPDAHPDQQEDCATAFDDDCDGTINQPTGVNLANCTNFSIDTDADGFGNAGDSLCLCEPDETHTASRRATATTATEGPPRHADVRGARREALDRSRRGHGHRGRRVRRGARRSRGERDRDREPRRERRAGAFFLLRGTSTGTIDLDKKGDPVIRIDGDERRAPRDCARGSGSTRRRGPAGRARSERRSARRERQRLRRGVISSPLATITGAALPVVLEDDDSDGDSLAQAARRSARHVRREESGRGLRDRGAAGGNERAVDLAEARISGTLEGELDSAALATRAT
jgi:hypothetical protein